MSEYPLGLNSIKQIPSRDITTTGDLLITHAHYAQPPFNAQTRVLTTVLHCFLGCRVSVAPVLGQLFPCIGLCRG